MDEREKTYVVRLGAYTQQEAQTVAQVLEEQGFAPVVETVDQTSAQEWTPGVGEEVYFFGNRQYASSDSNSGKNAIPGIARITAIAGESAHPYHLQRIGDTGPWGWVDGDSFRKGNT